MKHCGAIKIRTDRHKKRHISWKNRQARREKTMMQKFFNFMDKFLRRKGLSK
jgi:hypothetical protein